MILIMTRIRLFTVALLAGLGLTACQPATPSDPDTLEVVVAFYPLEYAATSVAGDLATVTNLTTPGTEPHDLELTPKQVASLTPPTWSFIWGDSKRRWMRQSAKRRPRTCWTLPP